MLMETAWQKFIANKRLRRLVVLVLLIFLLYEVRAMMNTILLTFIFTYLIVHFIRLLQRHIPRLSAKLIVIVIYILILIALYFVVTIYIPMLVHQVSKIFYSVLHFYQDDSMAGALKYLNRFVSKNELVAQAKNGMSILLHTLTSVGNLTVATFISLILSFFYTIELDQLNAFSRNFTQSGYLSWLFQDIEYFGKKFVNTFGVVLEAQFLIAICNTVLTLIGLAIMQMPQIIALGLMVFILSLIPVAGVIISLIPLTIIGYSVGGIRDVICIVIMILIIHAIEAYILNPKFMSAKTELPIFYTFLILLVAEHLWGTWGLIVGVPIFVFLLDILEIRSLKPQRTKEQKQ